jgi:hypothetical protein
MPFAHVTVLPCSRAPGGELVEQPAAAHAKKPLALSAGDNNPSFAELLARVRDACGVAPHARVALEFTDPGGVDQLELSNDAQLRTALAMLDDAPQARVLARRRTRVRRGKLTRACASQGSRLQLLARVVDESVPAAAAAPPQQLQAHRAPVDSSKSIARCIGYCPAVGAQQGGAQGGARSASERNASVHAALDGLPPDARAVLERVVWRGEELLLRAPTADALHAFGACRAAHRTTAHLLNNAISTGEALKPSAEDAARAKAVVQQLHVTLCGQPYGGCSVDRLRVSGSRGRSTSLMGSDVDVVLVLNKARPPWDPALADIARRLTEQLHVAAAVARCASGITFCSTNRLSALLQPVLGAHPGAAGLQLRRAGGCQHELLPAGRLRQPSRVAQAAAAGGAGGAGFRPAAAHSGAGGGCAGLHGTADK